MDKKEKQEILVSLEKNEITIVRIVPVFNRKGRYYVEGSVLGFTRLEKREEAGITNIYLCNYTHGVPNAELIDEKILNSNEATTLIKTKIEEKGYWRL